MNRIYKIIAIISLSLPVAFLIMNYDRHIIDVNKRVSSNDNLFIETQFLKFNSKTIFVNDFPDKNRYTPNSGGILFVHNDFVHYINQQGYIFSLVGDEIRRENIPLIKTNYDKFHTSKRYTYVETGPRILSAVVINDKLYISHHYWDEKNDEITARVSSISLNKKGAWNYEYISSPLDVGYYALGSGGRLYYHINKLYLTVGDQSLDRKNGLKSDFAAQNRTVHWGKILTFKIENSKLLKPEICSLGHRNPTGIVASIDPFDDVTRLYSVEHGPRGGDELNEIECGKNYGWPYFS